MRRTSIRSFRCRRPATSDEVKAYRKLARELHPDHNPATARPRSGSRPVRGVRRAVGRSQAPRVRRNALAVRGGCVPAQCPGRRAATAEPVRSRPTSWTPGGGSRRPAFRWRRLHRPVRHHFRWWRGPGGRCAAWSASAGATWRPRSRSTSPTPCTGPRCRSRCGHRACATPVMATGPSRAPSRDPARSATARVGHVNQGTFSLQRAVPGVPGRGHGRR